VDDPHHKHAHGADEHAHGADEHAHGADEHAHGHGSHHHGQDLQKTPKSRLVAALVLTAGFMGVEAGVGWWSGSLALVADAGHMLADAAALALAIVAQHIATRQRTRAQTYGYRRAEVLAAFANGIALGITALWIISEAVERFAEPRDIIAGPMIVTAVIGLGVNLGSAALLSGGHGGKNINTRAALAHVLADALASVGAIAAGIVVLATGWSTIDAIISVCIAVLIFWGGWRLVRDTARVLMEGTPDHVDLAAVEATLRSHPGVVDVHDLHAWMISDGFVVLTAHVVIKRLQHGTDVVIALARELRTKHDIAHSTIQPEMEPDNRLVPLGRKPRAEELEGNDNIVEREH